MTGREQSPCESLPSTISGQAGQENGTQTLSSVFNTRYITIHSAGLGAIGDVTFCFLRNGLKAVAKACQTDSSKSLPVHALEILKSQVCVVKFLQNPNDAYARTSLIREVDALRRTQASKSRTREQVAFFVDSDLSDRPWLVTAAVHGPTLETFLSSLATEKVKMPEKLFWHLYIQLSDAIRFLHTRKPRAMTHGDIHARNILLDSSYCADICLPNVVLIDFGMACIGEINQQEGTVRDTLREPVLGPEIGVALTSSVFEYDVFLLSLLLVSMLDEINWAEPLPERLAPFSAYVEKLASRRPARSLASPWCVKIHDIEKLWGRFGHAAIVRRDNLLDDNMESIRTALNEGPIDDQIIQKVLEDALLDRQLLSQ